MYGGSSGTKRSGDELLFQNHFRKEKRQKFPTTPEKPTGTTASDLGPPTPGLPSGNRRPSSPSSTKPKNPVNRDLFPENTNQVEVTNNDTTSLEAKLLKKLKKLSKMKPRIESFLEETGSVKLLELFRSSDSKSQDAWNTAGRGVILLKEGLEMVTRAENILSL